MPAQGTLQKLKLPYGREYINVYHFYCFIKMKKTTEFVCLQDFDLKIYMICFVLPVRVTSGRGV